MCCQLEFCEPLLPIFQFHYCVNGVQKDPSDTGWWKTSLCRDPWLKIRQYIEAKVSKSVPESVPDSTARWKPSRRETCWQRGMLAESRTTGTGVDFGNVLSRRSIPHVPYIRQWREDPQICLYPQIAWAAGWPRGVTMGVCEDVRVCLYVYISYRRANISVSILSSDCIFPSPGTMELFRLTFHLSRALYATLDDEGHVRRRISEKECNTPKFFNVDMILDRSKRYFSVYFIPPCNQSACWLSLSLVLFPNTLNSLFLVAVVVVAVTGKATQETHFSVCNEIVCCCEENICMFVMQTAPLPEFPVAGVQKWNVQSRQTLLVFSSTDGVLSRGLCRALLLPLAPNCED